MKPLNTRAIRWSWLIHATQPHLSSFEMHWKPLYSQKGLTSTTFWQLFPPLHPLRLTTCSTAELRADERQWSVLKINRITFLFDSNQNNFADCWDHLCETSFWMCSRQLEVVCCYLEQLQAAQNSNESKNLNGVVYSKTRANDSSVKCFRWKRPHAFYRNCFIPLDTMSKHNFSFKRTWHDCCHIQQQKYKSSHESAEAKAILLILDQCRVKYFVGLLSVYTQGKVSPQQLIRF